MAADEMTIDPLSLLDFEQTIQARLDENFTALRTLPAAGHATAGGHPWPTTAGAAGTAGFGGFRADPRPGSGAWSNAEMVTRRRDDLA